MISALLTALHLRIPISCETLVNFLCFIQELLCFFPSLLPKDFACRSNVTLIYFIFVLWAYMCVYYFSYVQL